MFPIDKVTRRFEMETWERKYRAGRTTCEISSRRHSSWKNTTKMCHRIFHSPVSLGENRVRKFVKYTRHAEVSIIDRRSFYVWKEVENVKWNLFTGRFVSEKNKFVDTPVSLKVERNHKQENFIPHFQFIFARATTSGRLFGSSLSEISHVPVYLINFQTRFPAELSREEKFLRYIFPPCFSTRNHAVPTFTLFDRFYM